ncbi:MAG: alpha/beta hydrolase [Eubacteriales bacterium]|nr:alpha/beta hydrolase [Eubacteriales bacterium]
MKWIALTAVALIAIYLTVQAILCTHATNQALKKSESLQAKTVSLSQGKLAYVDQGAGEPVLVVHGICGGYDQACETAAGCLFGKRIIAPSRFGYPGSDAPADPSPRAQAQAFAELLDELGIQQTYVLATSAGGTGAIRFALDYPERTKGLILMSSAPPLVEKPAQFSEYQGPPAFLCQDYLMWLMSPLFELTMGFESSTIHSMLPLAERKQGIAIDATITNPDMARNFAAYPIEKLQVPTIIFHAKDDSLASYRDMEQASQRFPDCTLVTFEQGGHKMNGHTDEIITAIDQFMSQA